MHNQQLNGDPPCEKHFLLEIAIYIKPGLRRVCKGFVKGLQRACEGFMKGLQRGLQKFVKGLKRVCEGMETFLNSPTILFLKRHVFLYGGSQCIRAET